MAMIPPLPYSIQPTVSSGTGTFVGTPNSTLYIKNLNEKKELFCVFSSFGKIYDIVLKKNIRMRGQAFIAFDKLEEASKALHSLQGHLLFYKPLQIKYAKFSSHIISKLRGSYEQELAHQQADKGMVYHSFCTESRSPHARLTRSQMMHQLLSSQAISGTPAMQNLSAGPDLGLPNKILFVQNLPLDSTTTEESLESIFSTYKGFREVRLIPSKKDIAFVEYENDVFANAARLALDHYKITPSHEIRVSFAKK